MAKREKKPNRALINTPETSIGNRDIRKFLKPYPQFSNENSSRNMESSQGLVSDSRDDMSTKFQSRSNVSISKQRQMRLTQTCLKMHIPEERLKHFKGLNIKPEDPQKGLRRLQNIEGKDQILDNVVSKRKERKVKNNGSRGKTVSKTKKVKAGQDGLKQEQINKYLVKSQQKQSHV